MSAMNAMVLKEIAPIESSPLTLTEMPQPSPGRGEARIEVHCCAICRTDLHVIEGELPRHTLPIVPGHQIVGTVDEVGEGCSILRVGQRVGVPWLRHTCGVCDFCSRGLENLCESSRYTGYHAHGGYAEYAVVPEAYAYPIPEAFEDVHAAPLLCAGIIGFRALKRCDAPPRGIVALYGFGSSAHVILQILKHRGHPVYVVTREKTHQELALSMGAEWAGDDPALMPQMAGSAIIFAPAGRLVPKALEALQKGGTVALAGIYMTDVPGLEYEKHLFYERNIRSVTANTRQDGREFLEEAARIPVRPHVTTYPLSEANRALQALKAGRINGSGVLVLT